MAGRRSPEVPALEALEVARELWQRAWASVVRTPGLLLLSLLIGGVLWVFVTDSENPTRVDLFPAAIEVEAANVGAGLAVANTLPVVQVRLSAADDRWEELSSANLRAFVDLNGMQARAQEVRVSVSVDGISGVRVVGTVPPVVTVNLEDFVSKDVVVAARLVGAVPLGYQVAATAPEQATVRVSGPESLVELVREAVAEANVSGLTVPLQQTVDLSARGEAGGEIRGVRIDPPSLGVSVTVVQTTLSRTLPMEAPVEGEPAAGYRVASVEVEPATLVVQGTIEVLQALEVLILPSTQIEGALTGIVTRRFPLTLPPGVRSAVGDEATVRVTVVAVEGSLRLSVAPQALEVADGLVARFEEGAVAVVLEGPMSVLGTLDSAQVLAFVDATDREAGAVELAVSVDVPEGVSVVAVQPPTLSVTLELSR
ncbi:MAG: CdaR family protein [Dehalococcoidia bacterium]|nr:CdaR family protein [Dehalococcoidia bacterium]